MAVEWQVVEQHLEAVMRSFPQEYPFYGDSPFVSAYQIAIRLADIYPDLFRELGYPMGGAGSGDQYSLPSFIAGQFVQHQPAWLDIAYLHRGQLGGVWFKYGKERIQSSTEYLTLFRIKPPL